MTFGEKIRNAREDLDLSQREVAAAIPMNQSNYSKIERDTQEPSITQLRAICRILHLDPRNLLDLTDLFDERADDAALLTELLNVIERHKGAH